MLNFVDRIFPKGKINRDSVLKNCCLGEMVRLQFHFRPWDMPVEASVCKVNVTGVDVSDKDVYASYRDEQDNESSGCVGRIDSTRDGWCEIGRAHV